MPKSKQQQAFPTVHRAILWCNIIFILPGLIMAVSLLVNPVATAFLRLGGIAALAALVFAAVYTLAGFSKKQAWAHKLFLAFFAVTLLLTLGETILGENRNLFDIILSAAAVVLLILLLTVKDLGMKRSFALCGAIGGVYLLVLFHAVLGDAAIGKDGDPYHNLLLLRATANLSLCLLLTTLTFSKYVDKAIRKG